MKITLIGFCLMLLLADSGCKKAQTSGPSSVYGQAVDQTTGKGVPYATVSLIGQNSNIIGAGGQQGLQTVNADVNGKFYFSFNYESGNDYKVSAKATNYYNDGNAFTTLSAGQNKDVKIDMNPEGWVRFYLVNVPPLDTIQEFILYDFDGEVDDNEQICKNKSYLVFGHGNTITHFHHRILRGSVLTLYSDSVFVKELDTVSYTINY